ncbi:MAG: hypothetical protein IT427_00315 [Pirellulales bacterium]|nr:hypothetical protein [Pirellulales bacterium]
MEISDEETKRFEAFLDRNFPGWREREMFKQKYAGTIQRTWRVGVDDVERCAIYRKDYVELHDQVFEPDEDFNDCTVHSMKCRLCAIEGDLTPVAKWGEHRRLPDAD